MKKNTMLVLGPHGKDREYHRDKANIDNPKVNRGCPTLTTNRTWADCMEITLGLWIRHIPLGGYHTGVSTLCTNTIISHHKDIFSWWKWIEYRECIGGWFTHERVSYNNIQIGDFPISCFPIIVFLVSTPRYEEAVKVKIQFVNDENRQC